MDALRVSLLGLLAGCGTLSYYGSKDSDPDEEPLEDDDDDDDDDNVEDTEDPGDDDDDDDTTPGDDDDDDDDDDTTTTTDTGEEECVYPSGTLTPSTPGGNMVNPSYVGMSFAGFILDDEIYGYTVEGVEYVPILIFTFFDASFLPMCDVVYDASGALPASGWTTDSGGTLWASFDVPISGGVSSCGNVSGYGFTDVRDWLEARTWGFGIGELQGIAADLQTAVNDGGGNWSTDWAPYTYALYATGGPFAASGSATEVSWAQSLDRDCAEVLLDTSGYAIPVSPPTGAPLDDFVNSGPFMIYLLQ
jgi:hypothetical protein